MVMPQFETENRHIVEKGGPFAILEYDKDLSPFNSEAEYFRSKMGVRRRQAICALNGQNMIILQAGAMQWMYGNVQMTSGVKGVGDFLGKALMGSVTGESASKPEYVGTGYVVLEPTYKYLCIEDVGKWGPAGIVLEDGMFLAAEGSLQQRVVARQNISSGVAGGEGLFNLALSGQGMAVLESWVPRAEMIDIQLNNEELKIDGNNAVCWSGSLQFTVERSSKSLIGSAASGEGLVNVYRGTGIVRMSPVAYTRA